MIYYIAVELVELGQHTVRMTGNDWGTMGMAICTCCSLKCTHFSSHSCCAQMHNVCSLMTLVPYHECSDPNSCPYTREDLQVQQAGTWQPLSSRLHHLLQFQPSPTCKQVWLTQHMCSTFDLPIHREILLTLCHPYTVSSQCSALHKYSIRETLSQK